VSTRCIGSKSDILSACVKAQSRLTEAEREFGFARKFMLDPAGGDHARAVLAGSVAQTTIDGQSGQTALAALAVHKADDLFFVLRDEG
jgi:hypothetical protein